MVRTSKQRPRPLPRTRSERHLQQTEDRLLARIEALEAAGGFQRDEELRKRLESTLGRIERFQIRLDEMARLQAELTRKVDSLRSASVSAVQAHDEAEKAAIEAKRDEMAQEGYDLRSRGWKWEDIGEVLEHDKPYDLVRLHAQRKGLKWPLPRKG